MESAAEPSDPTQPRLSPRLVAALVLAVLAVAALGLCGPHATHESSLGGFTAENAAALAGVWQPAALGLVACLVPLAFAYRFLDPRRYVVGFVAPGGQVSVEGLHGEPQIVAPRRSGSPHLRPGPVLLRLASVAKTVSPPTAGGYREAPVAPPVRSAHSMRPGSRAEVFEHAQRHSRRLLVLLIVACAFTWFVCQAIAVIADGTFCC